MCIYVVCVTVCVLCEFVCIAGIDMCGVHMCFSICVCLCVKMYVFCVCVCI